jgi:alkylation response protein AidB-like acyl-CoA dehydrogenase
MIDLNLPYLTEEHKSLAMLMKEFCEREVDMKALCVMADVPIPSNATSADLRARMPWDLIGKAHDAGLRQIAIPSEFGGGGYHEDHVAQGVMAETAGYFGGQFARVMTIPWKMLCNAVYWPKDIAEEVVGDFMNDRKTMMAGSLTEPNSGSDILLPYNAPGVAGAYFARQEGDDWIINGDKMFCTAGGVSNYIVVYLRTEPKGPITESFTAFMFPTNTPGWSINRDNDMMCNEIMANVQMRFDNCRLPDRYRLSPVNGVYKTMRSRVAGKTLHLFGLAGWAERQWEDMKEYAKARVQGGKPIIQHNNIGAMLAEGQALLQALRLMLYQNGRECSSQGRLINPKTWYYVNWYGKKVYYRLAEIGMEVYGGMAPQKELIFEHWVRFCLSMFHGGSTGILSLIKAGHMIDVGL